MNIFVTDPSPYVSAQVLPDKHVVKMPLETCQMLSIVCSDKWGHSYGQLHRINGEPYKTEKGAFRNHPCTVWANQSLINTWWLVAHGIGLCEEYTHRYGKWHGAMKHIDALDYGRKMIPEGWQTPHPQCFSGLDHLKTDEQYPIKAYRAFYIADKARFARYRYTQQPTWMKGVAL